MFDKNININKAQKYNAMATEAKERLFKQSSKKLIITKVKK